MPNSVDRCTSQQSSSLSECGGNPALAEGHRDMCNYQGGLLVSIRCCNTITIKDDRITVKDVGLSLVRKWNKEMQIICIALRQTSQMQSIALSFLITSFLMIKLSNDGSLPLSNYWLQKEIGQ